ncbi:putative protein TPRXL [Papaver somniferum]|uniref:putative protein TPRXL n=1 Tax=Papaver somniferum TaxID=3469 RepID=UPI000E6F6EEC|nr:putative protein TPRXL [Papaver somniferum]
MARTNKYSSINFNDIYDKKINPNKSSAATNSANPSTKSSLQNLSNSRIHGGMLVLTRPTPKPQPQIIPQQQQQPSLSATQIPKVSDQIGQDSISLRPGSTSTTSSQPIAIVAQNKDKESVVLSSSSSRSPSFSSSLLSSPKPEPFVPPHLRPGFAGKQDRLGQDGQKINLGFRSRELGNNQGHSANHYGDNGRPKSGGYYRGGDSDQELMNRPTSSSSSSGNLNRPNSSGSRPNSSGNRPNSGGWYGSSSSSYRSPHHF